MDIKTASHFGLLREVMPGDIVTHYNPTTGEGTTFEVIALLPTNTNSVVMLDTTIGQVAALAGTPVEIFEGFED
jgi:hypothetical protein